MYLDDILSAVDAHTSQHILVECFRGQLVRNRTFVLVTHHVRLCLPAADFVIKLDQGRILQACAAFEVTLDNSKEPYSPAAVATPQIKHRLAIKHREVDTTRHVYTKETRAIGRVAGNHYMLLLAAGGGIGYWSFMLFLTLGARLAEVGRQSVLANWTSHMSNTNLDYYITLYLACALVSNLFGGIRWVWLYGVGSAGMNNRMSKVVHNLLLDRICAAPLQFFESTPMGRLLNVFGQDIWRIDTQAADDVGRKSRLE